MSFHFGFKLVFLVDKSTSNKFFQFFLTFFHVWWTVLLDKEFSICFNILKMSLYCLLASMIANDKPAINLIDNPLYALSHFSLATFKILLSLTFISFCMCVSLQVYSTWVSWTYIDWCLSNLWCFAPFSSSFPSKIPIMCMLVHLMVSHRCVRLFLFFHSFFFLLFKNG